MDNVISFYITKICIAASEASPNKPKNPDTITVNRLIGICNPIDPPNTLKKNRNKIPIPNFTVLCAKNRVGLTGAPINNSKTIIATMIEIMIIELNPHSTPFPKSL